MKQRVVLGLLLVSASAASAGAQPLAAVSTTKGVEPFAQCFSAAQDRAGHAWAFVPRDSGGGTFSNVGAPGVRDPYFIQVADRGASREIRISASGVDRSLALAVQHCA